MKKAIQNGYTVIRILQEDVYNDRNNWKEWLKSKIKECEESKECLVFFPERKDYDKHKENYVRVQALLTNFAIRRHMFHHRHQRRQT